MGKTSTELHRKAVSGRYIDAGRNGLPRPVQLIAETRCRTCYSFRSRRDGGALVMLILAQHIDGTSFTMLSKSPMRSPAEGPERDLTRFFLRGKLPP